MSADRPLLLGEWACLGVLVERPAHGFAVAARMKPDADIGRVWSMSRALTYRALDQLVAKELVHEIGEERGIAGGNRTILGPTRRGRGRLRTWLGTPVEHLRDVRSELLLKVVLADLDGVDVVPMLHRQRDIVASIAEHMAARPGDDAVALWRSESSQAALRFVDRLLDQRS